jgi:hypothetical protein
LAFRYRRPFYLAGEEARYPSTPPEMFPIAAMGVDGVHYGYVIHAPELSAADYPLGHLCPMDAEGVSLLGMNTLEAIETEVSWHGSFGDTRLVCQALGIQAANSGHRAAAQSPHAVGSDPAR